MVFRYDAALDLVFKEEFSDQEGEENAQQPPRQQQPQAEVNEPRRKRPRYGNYELPFPESEEEREQEQEREPEEPEEVELQTSRRRRRPSPPAAAPEQLPFNHPAIKKEKERVRDN